VEMVWKCRRRVTASIMDWPLPPPVLGLEKGAVTPPAPTRKPALVLLVLTAIREPMIPPTTRTVVAALVMEEVGTFSARMSLGDSPGARMSCMSFNGGIPPG